MTKLAIPGGTGGNGLVNRGDAFNRVRSAHPDLERNHELFNKINSRRNIENLATAAVISAQRKTYPNAPAPEQPEP